MGEAYTTKSSRSNVISVQAYGLKRISGSDASETGIDLIDLMYQVINQDTLSIYQEWGNKYNAPPLKRFGCSLCASKSLLLTRNLTEKISGSEGCYYQTDGWFVNYVWEFHIWVLILEASEFIGHVTPLWCHYTTGQTIWPLLSSWYWPLIV